MASRPVATAHSAMQGHGYVVVGAEPGSVAGVTPIDPSELDRGIRNYLGSNGPEWRFNWILEAGPAHVLGVTVDPPRPGDRIRTLDKESERHLRGTVLIRRPGQTVQADPGEIRAMEDRHLASTLESRKREVLARISEAVDAAFEKVTDANTADRPWIIWTAQRNRVEDALEASDGPEMTGVVNFVGAGTAYQALMYYGAARGDIKGQFFVLDRERRAAGTN